jgi:hypothetical protein
MHRTFVSKLLLTSALIMAPMAAQAADSVGVIGALIGSAKAKSASGERALKVGDPIYLNESITTGAGSKAQLMLNDKSTVTLNSNSNMKVNEFVYDPSKAEGSLQMSTVKGAFRFIGGALSKQQEAKIKTPVSSIGIRGSIGDGAVNGQTGATQAVFNSGDQMSMTNGNGETVTTTDVGGGFALNTPNDSPQIMTPEQVNNVVNQTSDANPNDGVGAGSGEGDPGAAGDANAGGTDSASSEGEGDSGEGDGDSGGTDSASNEGGTDGGDGGDLASFGDSDGGDGTAGGDGAAGGVAGGVDAGGVDAPDGITESASTEGTRFEVVSDLSGGNDDVFDDPEAFQRRLTQVINNILQNGGSVGDGGSFDEDEILDFLEDLEEQDNDLGLDDGGFAGTPDGTPQTAIYSGVAASSQLVDGSLKLSSLSTLSNFLRYEDDEGELFATSGDRDETFNAIDESLQPTVTTTFGLAPTLSGFHNFTQGNDVIEIPTEESPDNAQLYKVFSYGSDSGETLYYLFKQVGVVNDGDLQGLPAGDPGEEISAILGQAIDLSDDSNLNAIRGTTMAHTADIDGQNTGNLSFYAFLPELTNHFTSDQDGDGAFGGSNFTFNTDTGALALDPVTPAGLAINWQKQQFMGGNIHWETDEAGINDKYIDTVTFGKTLFDQNTTSSAIDHLFKGAVYRNGLKHNGPNESVLSLDVLATSNNLNLLYSDGHATLPRIEALVFEAEHEVDGGVTQPIYQAAFALDATVVTDLQDVATDLTDPTSGLFGYSAGLMYEYEDADATAPLGVFALQSQDIHDTQIFTDIDTMTGATSSGAIFKMEDVFGVNQPFMRLFFGTNNQTGTVAGGESVFLSDDLYASQLAEVKLFDSSSDTSANIATIDDEPQGTTRFQPDTSPVIEGGVTGFMANSKVISDVETCATCDYVSWGVWSASVDNSVYSAGMDTAINVATLVPYVSGTPTVLDWSTYTSSMDTNTAAVRGLGFVNYTGAIIGTLQDNISDDMYRYTGSFTAGIDLTNRTLNSFTGQFGDTVGHLGLYDIRFPLGTTPEPFDTNSGRFSNIEVEFVARDRFMNGTTTMAPDGQPDFQRMDGTINGALFGPQAENVAGNFAVQTDPATGVTVGTPNEIAAGVFVGARP